MFLWGFSSAEIGTVLFQERMYNEMMEFGTYCDDSCSISPL